MIPNRIIYTDGHDVVVTDSSLEVKKHKYLLSGIIAHWIQVLKPDKMPWVGLLIVSAIVSGLGWLGLYPNSWNIRLEDSVLLINPFLFWLGFGLAVISILTLFFLREKYAVRIATAEGEKDAVVSENRDYITQVESALKRALSGNDLPEEPVVFEVRES